MRDFVDELHECGLRGHSREALLNADLGRCPYCGDEQLRVRVLSVLLPERVSRIREGRPKVLQGVSATHELGSDLEDLPGPVWVARGVSVVRAAKLEKKVNVMQNIAVWPARNLGPLTSGNEISPIRGRCGFTRCYRRSAHVPGTGRGCPSGSPLSPDHDRKVSDNV